MRKAPIRIFYPVCLCINLNELIRYCACVVCCEVISIAFIWYDKTHSNIKWRCIKIANSIENIPQWKTRPTKKKGNCDLIWLNPIIGMEAEWKALQLIKWKHIFPVLSSNAHSKSVNPSLCIFVTKGKFCNWILLLLFCVLFPRYSFWLHSLHMHELEDRPLIPSALWVVIMHMWAVHTNTPSKYVKTQQQHFLHWIRTIPTISATKTIHTFSLLYNKRDCMDKTFYHNIQKPLIQPTHPYVWAARDKAMTFLVSKSQASPHFSNSTFHSYWNRLDTMLPDWFFVCLMCYVIYLLINY